MIDILKIKPDHEKQVERREQGLWVERDALAQYTDIGAKQESELLIELRKDPWRDVVDRRFKVESPWLHKIITDRGRSLFLDLLPVREDGTFLDVGSGWGQIAIPLSQHGNVVCLDLTLSRLSILREIANQERAELNYVCGNYCTFPFDGNQFDLVVFNGSLEWIATGSPETSIWDAQKKALEKTLDILNPGGIVYIGIENSMGLKYILGAPDDHTGIQEITYLDEFEANLLYEKTTGKTNLRMKTWSLTEYKTLLTQAGLDILEIYACFPDYKIIRQMIPIDELNSYISENTKLSEEHSGVKGTPLSFNDKLSPVYRLLAKNGIAHYFCPSYAFVARKPR